MDAFQIIFMSCTAGVSLYQPLSIKPHNVWYIFLQIADSPLKAFFPYTSHYRDAFVTTNACTHIIPEIVFLHSVRLHFAYMHDCMCAGVRIRSHSMRRRGVEYAADKIHHLGTDGVGIHVKERHEE